VANKRTVEANSSLRSQTPLATLAAVNKPNMEPAMYARVMTSSPKPGSAETAIAEWPQHIGAFKGKGLVAGYLFFDRAANQFLSITIWESEEAQKRNATSPEQIHGRAEFMKHLTGAPVPSTYEVAAVVK
jgi:heme-degrading monooxygenase HmoA